MGVKQSSFGNWVLDEMICIKEPGRFGSTENFALLPPGTMVVDKLSLTTPSKQILKISSLLHSLVPILKQFRAIKESNHNCDTGKHSEN